MKRIFLLTILSLSSFLFIACKKERDWDYIKDKNNIIVGYTIFKPMAYEEENGLTGFDIELAQEVGKMLGVSVTFKKIDWDIKETELKSKSIDLIWNAFSVNDAKKRNMEFSIPYLTNSQVAIIRKDDAMKYAKDVLFEVDGTRYCAEIGSAGADVLIKQNLKYNQTKDMIACLTELNSNASDIAVMDLLMARAYMESNPNLMIVENCLLSEEEYGIAARKGDVVFVEKINDALHKLQENGKLNELATKYGLQNEIILK